MIPVRSWLLCSFKNVKVKSVFLLYFISSPHMNSPLLSFNLLWIFWLCFLQNFFWRALVKNYMDFEWKWEVIQGVDLLILKASVLLLHRHQENMQSYSNQLQHGCNQSGISSGKAQYMKTDAGGRWWKWFFLLFKWPQFNQFCLLGMITQSWLSLWNKRIVTTLMCNFILQQLFSYT